ncbi:DUF397 domain-containing protein [Streptomyces sp. NPDC004685]
MSTTKLAWFKSSYSGTQGDNCVEVAMAENIHVRDSKQRESGKLALSPSAWSEFVAYATEAQV